MGYVLYIVSILVLVIVVSKGKGIRGGQSSFGNTPYTCPECVGARVGPPEVLYGPCGAPLDNPFFAIESQGVLLGYSANGNTKIIAKGALNDILPPSSAPIVLVQGQSGSFDECGAWLNAAVVTDGSLVKGWYHAECKCNYSNDGQTHKSIAYAESTNGGVTYEKINYPNNLIITGGNASTIGRTTGNGDHSMVVGDDGYYYCFFFDWDYGHPAVARSLVSSGGVPGTWYKYFEEKWDEPGLGGRTSPISWCDSFTVKEFSSTLLAAVDPNDGVSVSFGIDALNWTSQFVTILYSEASSWTRNAQSRELVAYATFVPYSGTGYLDDEFWLYYTYLLPGQGFGDRYLVRRPVTLTVSSSAVEPQSGTALYRYVSGNDYWTTTAFVPSNYTNGVFLGYIVPVNYAETTPIYDCYITAWDDHMIGTSEAECASQGIVNLRQLGWVYTSPPTAPGITFAEIYRCFDSAVDHHYVSKNSDCDGFGKMEFSLGWIMNN